MKPSMKLPAGVFDRPRHLALIAKDDWAIIRIDTKSHPENAAYQINDRDDFARDVAPFLHGDWEEFDRFFGFSRLREAQLEGKTATSPVIFSGAEHAGARNLQGEWVKKPNITVVPNLSTEEARGLARPFTVFGCTLGHYHPALPTGRRVQEVYEFQSHGCMALDREEGQIELWVAQAGDKVAVPSGCHFTLYNIGDKDHPLVTLDFADPDNNPANQDLAKACGPVLLAYYDDFEAVFVLNRLHVNHLSHGAGVRSPTALRERREREVRIRRGGRLDLGRLLYEQLTLDPERIGSFARLGVHIKKATPEAVLHPVPTGQGARLYFSQRLVDAAVPGSAVYRFFIPTCEAAAVPQAVQGRSSGGLSAPVEDATRPLPTSRLNRPLQIVVEGVGDWVEQAYRPLFQKKASGGKDLAVFYADDTRWKDRKPDWVEKLKDWEVYLDKADPNDFARYRLLRPDAVFIVTPDFTHAATAQGWLGKAPLVFVEKPFDSHVKSVEDLMFDLGDLRKTAVLGLDHYQFYALPITGLKAQIMEHLGWALARVDFFMLEERAIELDRVRSLQHGLTLDMLPHLAALLTYFGDVETIDEIRVLDARQYDPLIAARRGEVDGPLIEAQFRNETYSRVEFTFKDESGNGFHVPCLATVGKGWSREAKYLEVTGYNGNSVRIEFSRAPEPDPCPGYPWDAIFFIQGDETPTGTLQVRLATDPHHPGQALRLLEDPSDPKRLRPQLERFRYEKLVDALLAGGQAAIPGILPLKASLEIVRALDRIWWAIQESIAEPLASWPRYDLKRSPVPAKK
jgi:predicted dehydrogenase